MRLWGADSEAEKRLDKRRRDFNAAVVVLVAGGWRLRAGVALVGSRERHEYRAVHRADAHDPVGHVRRDLAQRPEHELPGDGRVGGAGSAVPERSCSLS